MAPKNSKASLFFIALIAMSAIFLATNSAIFSITGLANLFAGAPFAVMIMAASLEAAKLLAASFLYRFWDRISKVLRIYLVAGVAVLVIISSMGIFGFLSKAYQESTMGLQKYTLELSHIEETLTQIQMNRAMLQDEMDSQIEELPEEYHAAKRQVRQEYSPLIMSASKEILKLQKERADIKQTILSTGVDVGPLLYMADALHTDIDKVASWLILVLVFVFDPMALALVIALNTALMERQRKPSIKRKPRENKKKLPIPDLGDERQFQREAHTLSDIA